MSEAVELLRSIDVSLKRIVKALQQSQPKTIASDRDLDGPHGNPQVKFMPRDWTGASFKNARFSECPPDLLDMVAEMFDYFAEQAEDKDERTTGGKSVAEYKRADAARARGWAKRIREGEVPVAAADANFGPAPEWKHGGDF